MADELPEGVDADAVAAMRKKRQFKKFTFRGLELEKLLDLSNEELLGYVHARARRRMKRGLKINKWYVKWAIIYNICLFE